MRKTAKDEIISEIPNRLRPSQARYLDKEHVVFILIVQLVIYARDTVDVYTECVQGLVTGAVAPYMSIACLNRLPTSSELSLVCCLPGSSFPQLCFSKSIVHSRAMLTPAPRVQSLQTTLNLP